MNQKHIDDLVKSVLAIEAEEAKEAGTLGYMARVLTQATFPHRAPSSLQFTRRNGAFELSITALSPAGLPYGSIPRLLLSWMTTEAVRTQQPDLELGPTLSAFMAELGLTRCGGKKGDITRLRNQMMRLFCSAVSCRYDDENHDQGVNFNIANKYDLWWSPKSPNQLPLWKSTVTLGQDFFNHIIERPVPVDLRALKALKRSPLALDIYCWLTYRMSYLRRETEIPWAALQLQFGSDYERIIDFKRCFLKQLKFAQQVYDQAKVEEGKRGLILKPSPPHIALQAKSLRVPKAPAPPALPSPYPAPTSPSILLKPATYEKARQAAPGFDVYALEQDWREWIAQKGEQPKNPDSAFIGFCRQKARPKTVGP
ncbi:MAG: pirin [Anaerolineae bacterium]|nr:pirin [Anaerolineae bacterium]